MAGESKEVPELQHNGGLNLTTTEIHVVTDVVRDGGGNLVSKGNSRRATLAELLAMLPTRRLFTVQVLGQAPTANEVLALYPATAAASIPANFAGSKASVLALPTADLILTFSRQVAGAGAFATIGTLTIAAANGSLTWATTGGLAIAIAAGDVIKVTADADGDGSFIGAVTVAGQ